VNIKNIGNIINTEYSEYVPIVAEDTSTIIFTYRGPGSTGGLQKFGQADIGGYYYEDVFIAYRFGDIWSVPISISDKINTNIHDAVTGISSDGKTLLLYRSDGTKGVIYFTIKTAKGWSEPKKLSKTINSQYSVGHASFTADGNELYLVIDGRPDSYGGQDIYKSVKDKKGKWTEPVNLGPNINTPYDEEAPFIYTKANVLYFASKGHNSIGGYDIFRSINIYGQWSKPQNMAYPINTPDDDLYFFATSDGKRGYFASRRGQGYGIQDVYTVSLEKLALPFVPDTLSMETMDKLYSEVVVEEVKPEVEKVEPEVEEVEPEIEEVEPEIEEVEPEVEEVEPEVEEKDIEHRSADGLTFKVQVAAFRKKIPVTHTYFAFLKDKQIITKTYEDGITRYTIGSFKTLAEANQLRPEIMKRGFGKAFIIAHYRQERIAVYELEDDRDIVRRVMEILGEE